MSVSLDTTGLDPRTPTLIFNCLAVSGLILLLATVVPAALSPNISRSKTWFSMIISWMVYASSYMLILGHQLGPDPPRGICGLQMLFIYACPPLTAFTGLAFVLDVYLRITGALFTNKTNHKYTMALLTVPWALFVVIAAEALIVVGDFAEIQRDPNHMYCHSVVDTQTRVSAFLCVFGLGTALCLEIWTAVILYRNWVRFRHLTGSTKIRDLRLSSLIRLLVFTLQTSTGLGLGATVTGQNVTEGLALWSAVWPILPVLCGIAFGTQQDILRCWMFWRPGVNGANSSTLPQHSHKTETV